jgi:hypothetical protein
MNGILFERQCRTPYSESYYILQSTGGSNGSQRLGALDLHFTNSSVRATLIVERELDQGALAKLIEQIDEDLVLCADVPRDDFMVSVYVGRDAGFYSDEESANGVESHEGKV